MFALQAQTYRGQGWWSSLVLPGLSALFVCFSLPLCGGARDGQVPQPMTTAKHRPVFLHGEKEGRDKTWPVYTLEEVGEHAHKDDCWIVVNDKVYDMTKHMETHEGWNGSGKVSTLVALLSAMGTDCTDDVLESHDRHAMRQISMFQIGVLDEPNGGSKLVRFLTWEQIEEAAFDASVARSKLWRVVDS